MSRPLLLLPLLVGCTAVRGPSRPGLVVGPRAATAVTGTQLLSHLENLSLADREKLLWREFTAGNLPTFLRTLVPITTQAVIQGRAHTATFWCTPDYLGIGEDGDWFRMPMTPTLCQRIADRFDCALPTRRMVDTIWAAAPIQLAPFPYSPKDHDILSVDLFHQHHLQIERQRMGRPQGLLTAGIKKDVVATAWIGSWPGRVVIYGWHHQDGTPIQPLSKVHTFAHVDYSHGLRLVSRHVDIDGVRTTIDAVLADPVLHSLLSDEGALASWRYPAGTAESFPGHDTLRRP